MDINIVLGAKGLSFFFCSDLPEVSDTLPFLMAGHSVGIHRVSRPHHPASVFACHECIFILGRPWWLRGGQVEWQARLEVGIVQAGDGEAQVDG